MPKDASNGGAARTVCPILMLNYPDAPAVYCVPGACSAWRPAADAGPDAPAGASGVCVILEPAGPNGRAGPVPAQPLRATKIPFSSE